jgi:hypothetical protein
LEKHCLENDRKFSLLKWTAQSPDLNPIEHILDEMEQAVRSMNGTAVQSAATA